MNWYICERDICPVIYFNVKFWFDTHHFCSSATMFNEFKIVTILTSYCNEPQLPAQWKRHMGVAFKRTNRYHNQIFLCAADVAFVTPYSNESFSSIDKLLRAHEKVEMGHRQQASIMSMTIPLTLCDCNPNSVAPLTKNEFAWINFGNFTAMHAPVFHAFHTAYTTAKGKIRQQ